MGVGRGFLKSWWLRHVIDGEHLFRTATQVHPCRATEKSSVIFTFRKRHSPPITFGAAAAILRKQGEGWVDAVRSPLRFAGRHLNFVLSNLRAMGVHAQTSRFSTQDFSPPPPPPPPRIMLKACEN
jgi:hypothetical protein